METNVEDPTSKPKPFAGITRPRKKFRLPPDDIERCVRTVELALRLRAAHDEAVAAIDRLFGEEKAPPPTLKSSVHDIGLRLRTASILDDAEIRTAFDLRIALLTGRIWTFPQFGPATVRECRQAIRLIEGRVRDWQI